MPHTRSCGLQNKNGEECIKRRNSRRRTWCFLPLAIEMRDGQSYTFREKLIIKFASVSAFFAKIFWIENVSSPKCYLSPHLFYLILTINGQRLLRHYHRQRNQTFHLCPACDMQAIYREHQKECPCNCTSTARNHLHKPLWVVRGTVLEVYRLRINRDVLKRKSSFS